MFLQKLASAGGPKYAVYDVEFDLGEDRKECRTVYIRWIPGDTPVKVCLSLIETIPLLCLREVLTMCSYV